MFSSNSQLKWKKMVKWGQKLEQENRKGNFIETYLRIQLRWKKTVKWGQKLEQENRTYLRIKTKQKK